MQQHQQPTSTTPADSGPVKSELIDAKFDLLAKRVLSQLNEKPVEFFNSLDNILTEPLDQLEIDIREARAAKQAALARNRSKKRQILARNNNNNNNLLQQDMNDNHRQQQYYEKTSGNIVNVTGNTPPSAASRAKNAFHHHHQHNIKSISPNSQSHQHYHSIERISSPSQNNNNNKTITGPNSLSSQGRKILDQTDSSFEIEQLVYSDELEDDDDDNENDEFDDDDDDDDDEDSLNTENYITNNQGDINMTRAEINNYQNVYKQSGPVRGIVKNANNSATNAPHLAHLNPIMRSNSLGTPKLNDPVQIQKVKSPTKSNIVSPDRLKQASLQKSKTSHDSLSIRMATNNIASKLSPSSNRIQSHNELQQKQQKIITSHLKHHHNQQQQPKQVSKNQAEPSAADQSHLRKPTDEYKALDSSFKSQQQHQYRLSDGDDDEIIIIPTKSPSLISNPSPDPDFVSNSGLDSDVDAATAAAAAAAAANERFSISRTKSFWEKLSNNKTARGVNRRASATKSLSTSLIGANINNNSNSITGNLNSTMVAINSRPGSGISTSENNNNNNNIEYKHQSLTNHIDHLNHTANQENIDHNYNDRYHYNNSTNSHYSNY